MFTCEMPLHVPTLSRPARTSRCFFQCWFRVEIAHTQICVSTGCVLKWMYSTHRHIVTSTTTEHCVLLWACACCQWCPVALHTSCCEIVFFQIQTKLFWSFVKRAQMLQPHCRSAAIALTVSLIRSTVLLRSQTIGTCQRRHWIVAHTLLAFGESSNQKKGC